MIRRVAGEAFVLAVGLTVASTAFVLTTAARAALEAVTLTKRVRELKDMVDQLEDRFEAVYAEHEANLERELAELLDES